MQHAVNYYYIFNKKGITKKNTTNNIILTIMLFIHKKD